MKNKKILSVLAVIAVLAMMLFTACGSKAEPTLESYVNDNEEVKTELDEAVAAQDTEGMKVDIQGNDIVYTFDLASFEGLTEEQAKDDSVKTALEAALEENADAFKGVASEIGEKTEIKGIRVIVNYTYGDEVIASATFEPDTEGE